MAIVGIIAGIVLPKVVTHYQTSVLDSAYSREIETIKSSLSGLAVTENKKSFYSTMMYTDTYPAGYARNAGLFMKKYLLMSQYCGENNGDCFAEKYYIYETGKKKKEYIPAYKGACGRLKNGTSICLIPQIGGNSITGIIDINGIKGPNVYGRDLREFTIAARRDRAEIDRTTDLVYTTDFKIDVPSAPEEPSFPEDPCSTDPNGLSCCQTKTITNSSDPCCTYDEINNSIDVCQEDKELVVNIRQTHTGYRDNQYVVFLYSDFTKKEVMSAPTSIIVKWFHRGNTGAQDYWASCVVPAGSWSCYYTPPFLDSYYMLAPASKGSATPILDGYKYKFYY